MLITESPLVGVGVGEETEVVAFGVLVFVGVLVVVGVTVLAGVTVGKMVPGGEIVLMRVGRGDGVAAWVGVGRKQIGFPVASILTQSVFRESKIKSIE